MSTAAFKAEYSDWKLIRTRKCVQIVFELPLEVADAAYQVLGGMPDPSTSVWFGIAKLQQPKEGSDERGIDQAAPRQDTKTGGARSWTSLPYSSQAAIACNDATFRAFMRETDRGAASDADEAAVAVRLWCGVTSRTTLNDNPEAAAAWLRLYDHFQEWKVADRVAS